MVATVMLQDLKANDLIFYLSYVGENAYAATREINPASEKDKIIAELFANATGNEMLLIITNLLRHEYAVGLGDPIRSGNRLIGRLLSKYVEHIDGERFKQAYKSNAKAIYEFKPEAQLSLVFSLIKSLMPKEQGLEDKIRILPLFYYEQLLQPTVEEYEAGIAIGVVPKAVKLTSTENKGAVDEFNEREFNANYVLKKQLNKAANQQAHDKLENIVHQITARCQSGSWEVGYNLGFFILGGVNIAIEGKNYRVPHRVADLYQLASSNESALNASERLNEVIITAQQAIEKPRNGRAETTTTFYFEVVRGAVKAPVENELTSETEPLIQH